MIKARRKSTTTTGTKKNNAAARATGKNKASRAANLAARRGLATNKKANAMEVEKQVQRQAGRAGAAGQGGRKNTAAGKGGKGRGGGYIGRGVERSDGVGAAPRQVADSGGPPGRAGGSS